MEPDRERRKDLARKVASLVESRVLRVAEPLSLAGLLGFFLWKSWLRWPEPLIDFSCYLYTPWRMSQGALLYQDLICFYGPLPDLVQAEAFRLFGPGLDVIMGLNIAVTVGVLALLRGIFRMIGNRLSGWLCGVVFVVFFAVPLYGNGYSLFNFIAPYSCQATWGFGGVLLTIYALLRHAARERRRWLLVAGLGLGIAFLDKPELLLTTLGALGMYLGLALLQTWRQGRTAGGIKPGLRKFAGWLGWGLCGFLAAYLPVFLVLAQEGGWAYGFRAANWTLQVFFNPDYSRITRMHFQYRELGFDQPWTNLRSHLQWGMVLLVFCAVMGWAGCGWQKARSAGRTGLGFMGLIMALSFLVILFFHWLVIGRLLLVPTVLTLLITVGWSLRRAWQGRKETDRLAGLTVVATAAMLMLSRMLLNVRIYDYGFFLAVLATLLLVHILVYELPGRLGGGTKPNGLLQTTLALLVLAGAVQLGRNSLASYAQRNFPIGQGRDRFYYYTQDINPDGIYLDTMVKVMQERFDWVKTVVAFPESQAVNYQLRKIDPVPDTQFAPDELRIAGIDNVLAKLAAQPPEAVVINARSLPEYGDPYFGATASSGKAIVDWVKSNYTLAYFTGNSPYSDSGHAIDIFIRRDLAAGYSGGSK